MKQLTCEMCGGTDLIKQDGVFVCQNCGCKYSAEDAKTLIKKTNENIEDINDISKMVKDHIKESKNKLYILLAKDEIEVAKYHILEYLRDANYVVDDIFNDINFGDIHQDYAIIALFGGPITYHWTASSGYDREEVYTEYVEKCETVNGKTRFYKEPVTKTRIVTDWRPSSGTVSDYYSNSFIVNSTSFHNDASFRMHLQDKVHQKCKDAISLWEICKKSPDLEEKYDIINKQIPSTKNAAISLAERSSGSYNIPGDHYKDVHDTADFRLESFSIILYPIFKGEYKHKETVYKFSVDAIDGNQNSLSTEYPIQEDDKGKHELILSKAKSQKQDKIIKKQKSAKTVIGIGWGLSIPIMLSLVFKWAVDGKPSLIFPILILLGAIIWHFSFKSKFKNDISNIIRIEDQNIKRAKHAIENANQYKKELRQDKFIKYINDSGCEKFVELSNNYVAQKSKTDTKEVDNVLYSLNDYEKQERIKKKTKETSFPESCKVLWTFFIIGLFIGSGFFIATILNIFSPTSTKMTLGIIGTVAFSLSWLFFWLGNIKVKKLRSKEQLNTKRNKIASILGIVCMCMVISLGTLSIATPAIKKAQTYSQAEKLIASGDYVTAIALFDELNDVEKVNEYSNLAIEQQVAESKEVGRQTHIGSVITIGNYNAVVLDKETDRILIMLLSYNGSDSSRNLNTVYQKIYDLKSSSWETSSLRGFLNGAFLNEFQESINRLILETDLPNITQSGEDLGTTKDKVFLLSAVSDKHYIDAIIDNGMIINSTTFTRTPAGSTTVVSIDVDNYFDGTGNHYAMGEQEVSNSYYIRPCMWLDIS